jgi:hypothetical protein
MKKKPAAAPADPNSLEQQAQTQLSAGKYKEIFFSRAEGNTAYLRVY